MPFTPTTRASLLFRLRDSDDHEAWVEFVTLYEPVIYRSLRQHGLQDVDARDVMQDLLLIVSRNVDRWQPGSHRGSFRAWLRLVMRNLVIHWVKQRRRQVVAAGDCDMRSLLEELPTADDPDSIEFDHEVHRAIFQRATQQVQSEVRQATWEAFWEVAVAGKSAAETAAKLGMTVTAVRVAKCRVLARVRSAVAELEKTK